LRKALVAPPGYQVLAADLAQIEARVLASVAEQESLVGAFRGGEDVYASFAAQLYGVPGLTKDSHPRERQMAKSAVLGAGYGLGARGFRAYCDASGLAISEAEAAQAIDGYRRLHPNIVALWKRMGELLPAMSKDGCAPFRVRGEPFLHVGHEYVELPSRRRLTFPQLHRRDSTW